MTVGTFSDFLRALGQNESGNNYAFVSSLGYLGRFQFGEEALKAIGFYAGDDGTGAIDFIGSWTPAAAAYGVTDKQGFLGSAAAQDAAAQAWFALIHQSVGQVGLSAYVGQWVDGVQITPSGLIAGAHLVGVWALKTFLESGGRIDTPDGYGTPVSEYVQRFGDFDIPFGTSPPAGGGANDVVFDGPGASDLHGYSGDDSLDGGGGADTVSGEDGADYLRGGDGADRLLGGEGADDLNGNAGQDTAFGGAGDDWVVGGRDGDLLWGEAGRDIVLGNLGDDTLDGGDGADQVRGGQGDDVVQGGAGDDFVSGDRGADTLTGGAGADLFHSFHGAGLDRILDFNAAEGDRVMLEAGTAWSARQAGADTVVDLGGGDTVVLAGVQLSNLPSGWIFSG